MDKRHPLYATIKDFPTGPGVYIMKDRYNKIIYIGKAKNLPVRLTSYFRNIEILTPKTKKLVEKVHAVEFITTLNEIEALILEQNLIKKHNPKYNISLKDDKRYPYIKITREDFPRIYITRKITKDHSQYYGPYTEVKELRAILKTVRGIFQYRTCNLDIKEKGIHYQPCFHYQTKRCPAPCTGKISAREYQDNISLICDFLTGKTQKIKEILTEKMNNSAGKEKFEDAAKWRDMIQLVQKVAEKQSVSSELNIDKDFIAAVYSEDKACISVFEIKSGKLLGKNRFFFSNLDLFQISDIMESFIKQYYYEKNIIPHQIILNQDVSDTRLLEEWLTNKSGRKTKIITSPASQNQQLIQLVEQNSKFYLAEFLSNQAKKEGNIYYTVDALQKNLNLPRPPVRIEGFDISHSSGKQTTASSVCFLNGKPAKRLYRQFTIKTVKGIDDFKSMEETIRRKYTRAMKENQGLPDLILIDGGKGQLNSAKKILDELELNHIPIIGLAKKFEEIYFPGESDPLILPKTSPALKLLQSVRDESHRFAVTSHRKKREKEFTQSILDQIPGIGAKRKQILLKTFGSIQEISITEKQSIKEKTQFPDEIVERIYQFFHYEEFSIVREKYGLYEKE